MRNMTLWTAAGLSVGAAAVSLSGNDTGAALRWLGELCLPGPVLCAWATGMHLSHDEAALALMTYR